MSGNDERIDIAPFLDCYCDVISKHWNCFDRYNNVVVYLNSEVYSADIGRINLCYEFVNAFGAEASYDCIFDCIVDIVCSGCGREIARNSTNGRILMQYMKTYWPLRTFGE